MLQGRMWIPWHGIALWISRRFSRVYDNVHTVDLIHCWVQKKVRIYILMKRTNSVIPCKIKTENLYSPLALLALHSVQVRSWNQPVVASAILSPYHRHAARPVARPGKILQYPSNSSIRHYSKTCPARTLDHKYTIAQFYQTRPYKASQI